MTFEQWAESLDMWGASRSELRGLYDRGFTVEQVRAYVAEYGIGDDPTGWGAPPEKRRPGRPRMRYDWRKAQIRWLSSLINDCNYMVARQWKSERDRQKVFEARSTFERLRRDLES